MQKNKYLAHFILERPDFISGLFLHKGYCEYRFQYLSLKQEEILFCDL